MRPPPWLAFPPLLAISRCFAGSIAAKPRFEPPLFVAAICFLPADGIQTTEERLARFTMLMEVSELLWAPGKYYYPMLISVHCWNHKRDLSFVRAGSDLLELSSGPLPT